MMSERNDIKNRRQKYKELQCVEGSDQIQYRKINVINEEVMKRSIKICMEGHTRNVMISCYFRGSYTGGV